MINTQDLVLGKSFYDLEVYNLILKTVISIICSMKTLVWELHDFILPRNNFAIIIMIYWGL
jgi:hypothetical protein